MVPGGGVLWVSVWVGDKKNWDRIGTFKMSLGHSKNGYALPTCDGDKVVWGLRGNVRFVLIFLIYRCRMWHSLYVWYFWYLPYFGFNCDKSQYPQVTGFILLISLLHLTGPRGIIAEFYIGLSTEKVYTLFGLYIWKTMDDFCKKCT